MTQEKIRKAVEEYLDKNAHSGGVEAEMLMHVPSSREHIINIGTSIMCTKLGIGPEGGGFVQAFVNNDLRETFGRADQINRQCIRLYLLLSYNLRIPQ
jgi:hypothetical protein